MKEKKSRFITRKADLLSNRRCKGYGSTCLTTNNAFDEATFFITFLTYLEITKDYFAAPEMSFYQLA